RGSSLRKRKADADASDMERSRRSHEAEGIAERRGVSWRLEAMRMPVKDGKEADKAHGDDDGKRRLKRHHETEHDDGSCNARLNERNFNATHADHGARRHERDEGRGNKPQRAPAKMRGEQ